MHTLLNLAWFLLPLTLFLMALWNYLERRSPGGNVRSATDLFKNGLFTLGCCVVALLIDWYLLEDLVNAVSPSFISLGVYQFLLLPFVLLVAFKIMGPSKEIKVKKRTLSNPRLQRQLQEPGSKKGSARGK